MNKITKIYVYILTVTLLLGVGQVFAAWDGSSKSQPSSSKDGYYQITNENELAWFAGQNCNSGNIRLMADMDMGGHHFVPLCAGDGGTKFSKIFDGNKFTIKNLYIDSDTLSSINTKYAQNLGLIAALSGKIMNVNFENAKIYASQDEGKIIQKGEGVNPISVGVAVGWMAGGTVSGVNVISSEVRTSGTGQSVGGVVGYVEKNSGPATISNCYSNAEIIAYGNRVYAGGVAGYAKGDDITISGIVFDGTVDNEGNGESGGILGKIANNSTIVSVENCYYDSTVYVSGIGDVSSAGAGKITGDTTGVQVVNSEKVACALNGGELDETGVCDKQEPWSLGQSGSVSLNGSDGYKITFVSNGGVFPEGAKTFKFVSKGGSITSDEIATPTREGKKFAGWALNADATEPDADLGTATGATKVYAVWYSFYTVSFSAESWESAKTTRVAKHGTITVDGFDVPEPYTNGASEKYFFTGWAYESKFLEEGYDASADDTLHLANIDVVSDVVLHAVWTRAETYSVTFNAMEHGNTDVHFVKIVSQGDTVSEPENFVGEEGYKLEGWYSDAERENRYNFGSTITKNIILYAKWDTLSYNITYENCKEGCVNVNPATYTKASATVTFAKASRNGYTFDGWFYDSDFKTPATQIASGSTGEKTIYAKWTEITYTVRYAAGTNGLGNYPDAIKHVGKDLPLLGAVMRRAGYTQVGWATSDGGEKVYELEATYSKDADLTLYPVWEIVTYTITYVCDGCVNNPLNPETYTIDKKWSIKYATPPEGFAFGGWFTNTKYEKKVQQLDSAKAYGDTTLYGKLNKIYHITYVLNGSADDRNKDDYTVDDNTYTLNDPAPVDGYTFAGWYDNAEFEGDAVTAIAKGSTGDKTFYAKWIPNTYTVTYDAGEFGEGTVAAGTKTHDVDFELSSDKFTRTGYTQDGWENVNGDVVSSPYTENADITLYPHWTLDTYTITYVGADDLENSNPTSYTVLENALALLPVAKSGFKFLGWFNESDELVESIPQNSTGDITLTAHWAEFPITVATYGGVTILENEDGTRTAAIDASSMETVEIAEDVSVDNVTFDRAFTVGATSTIMLPFSIATSKVSGGKFYEFADLQKNEETGRWAASVKPPEQSELQANKPYLFIPEETSIVFNLGGEPVSLNTSVMNPSTSGNWSFKGVYEKTVFTEEHPELGKAYGFSAEDKNGIKIGQFFKAGLNAWLRPFRAYLAYNEPVALAKSTRSVRASLVNGELPETIDVEIQDGTTRVIGGGTLNTRTGEIKMDRWYDMNGRRLNSKPMTRGTYYYNGKRIVVR